MNSIKHWKDWLHPVATVMGAWGGFPKPPKLFLELTRFEIFRWFLVFILAYQGGAEEDIKGALLITVVFYLTTKLLDLRDVVNDVAYSETEVMRFRPKNKQQLEQQQQLEQSSDIQDAQAAAKIAAADAAAQVVQNSESTPEAFFGGYYI